MRERLIELLGDYLYSEQIADHLIANGVIVPPCKVGDKLHKIHTEYTPFTSEIKVEEYGIPYKNVLGHWDVIPFEAIGKTVFLTREEAEAALRKEGEGK